MPVQKHILVLGAGVIGLQTAIQLLQAGYSVTVVAKHLPGDVSNEYTSPWAAAMWRSNALPHEQELQDWDRESYRIWLKKCGTRDPKGAGVHGLAEVPMRLLWTGPHSYIPAGPSSIWYAPHVRNFNVTPRSSLPTPFSCGATHDGIAINTPLYLQHLLTTAQSLGAVIIRATLPTTHGLSHGIHTARSILTTHGLTTPISLTINATGLGAHTLVPDSFVHPIRGQTITIRGEAKHITTMFYPECNASITPRIGSGVSVLGSTYQEGNWDPEPGPDVTQKILKRCKPLAPELLDRNGEFEVLSVDVAFRPGRTGGPRVEIEVLEAKEEGRLVVCHEYGHAGGGFQNSFGSAEKVVRLVDEWFRMNGEVAQEGKKAAGVNPEYRL